MKNLIEAYIKDHKLAWSPTTLKSERARLLGSGILNTENPQELYERNRFTKKPYTLSTLFVRLAHFYNWLLSEGHRDGRNEFEVFKRKNRNLFKGAYRRKEVGISFVEARNRISTISCKSTRQSCLSLLFTGLRISEAYNIEAKHVNGKGGKERRIFGDNLKRCTVSKDKVRRALKKIGLKPHDLRKLFLTQLAEAGASPQDLCKIAGWSSIETAYRYLQPKADDELASFVKGAING